MATVFVLAVYKYTYWRLIFIVFILVDNCPGGVDAVSSWNIWSTVDFDGIKVFLPLKDFLHSANLGCPSRKLTIVQDK